MRKFIVISALVALSSTAAAREEQKLFKWTDDEGNVYYSDSIPAEFKDRPKEARRAGTAAARRPGLAEYLPVRR